MNFLVVDLNEGTSNKMGFGWVGTSNCDYLTKSTWNNALGFLAVIATHHRVSFTTTRLPIGENCAIVTIEDTIDEGEGRLLVDEALGTIISKDIVVGETFGWFAGVFLD